MSINLTGWVQPAGVIAHVSVFLSSTRLQPFTVICRNKLNKEQQFPEIFLQLGVHDKLFIIQQTNQA